VEKHLGTSVESGMGIAFFAVGGIIMGAVYGKLVKLTRNCSLAVGCLLLVIAYLIIAYSNNMVVCYIGSFINGMAVSAFLPGIYINASKSVDAFSAGMAISVVTCAQNFGQFACPYIINSISGYLSHGKNQNFTSFLVGAVMATVLTVIILAWGIKKNRQTTKTVSPLFQGEE
jgi:MFS family permease